jgi:hypothetical protein
LRAGEKVRAKESVTWLCGAGDEHSNEGHVLIGIIADEDGREVLHYFTSSEDHGVPSTRTDDEHALALAGAWADLD